MLNYSDLFLSGFSEGWTPLSQFGFDQEEFIVHIGIPVSLPSIMKESINFCCYFFFF